MNEIERKWLLKSYPLNISSVIKSTTYISQFYIFINPEVRVRKTINLTTHKENFTFTIKKGSGIQRKEYEFKIPSFIYSILKRLSILLYKNLYITKTRMTLNNGIEINNFINKDFELIEKEFKTIGEANAFIPPDWFGEEVTDNDDYKNINIAKR